MEQTSKNNPYDGLNDFLSKNRSSLSVEEVKQLKKLLSTIEEDLSESTGGSNNKETLDTKKNTVMNALKQLMGFILKHEIYSYVKEFLD
ncbi:hypothetical protein [Aureispira anguillae]|uniref:Uncharacterized protein n=1 Tax=Aureispira anguillae TaxID=2864201 RepID=A0A915YM74_9BACT|nr:hypothetical protein [Aureispira anguillae]BDS15690.1 hypothetical protein AsAng_0064740 [Aureispira anguillae]